MPLKHLGLKNTDVTDISAISGMPLEFISLPFGATNLSPLRGLPLKTIEISHTSAKDIRALEGMKLESLTIRTHGLIDYSPLRNVEVKNLAIHDVEFHDLSVITHMPLQSLTLQGDRITDLSPLRILKLDDLNPVQDLPKLGRFAFRAHCMEIDFIREIETIYSLNTRPFDKNVDQFWREFDARREK
ncbi:MAG: hypothetical protein CMJ78_17935 [Planctomycetaceae bacterium]|nr:hypothetical protein [Planctomycetaceae bacterium]